MGTSALDKQTRQNSESKTTKAKAEAGKRLRKKLAFVSSMAELPSPTVQQSISTL